jgi:hypothetical protein
MRTHIRRTACVLGLLLAARTAPAQAPAPPATDPGWPRSFQKDGTTVLLYQPQVDAWKDYTQIRFRCALEITMQGADQPAYGVAAVQADTAVNDTTNTVLLTNLQVAVRFPGMSDDQAAPLKALVTEILPNRPYISIDMSRVLAYMHSQTPPLGVPINLDPPPIYYSAVPAVLVVYLGPPEFKPVAGTTLMFAVNTNWPILLDTASTTYYLLNGTSWLTAPDALKGPWTAAAQLPAEFSNLPTDGSWDEVRKQVPGQPAKVVPAVYASTQPAELIVTSGTPAWTPIDGTSLMYVSNPATPVFQDLNDSNVYYLVAGRWFRAPAITGPWSAASANLPAEFAQIPADNPMSFVLSSVPGTQQARDAILLASVPHKATVTISGTPCTVTYQGAPKFVPIQGTTMTYAVNTPNQVVFADGQYYCCSQGVWFVAPQPTGAWVVCTSVPAVIYTIPPSSPLYNVTYVKVYSTTPTTVVYGYTAGYSGAYVATTGALMFGAGMAVGAIIASNDNCCWYGYHPCYYSYGCAPYYHYGYGGYYRAGGAYYGPYGGAGWAAGYNPATGNYYRGGAAYGPGGAHWGGEAYNPWTNTYGAHTGGTNGYQSWGHSYVQQGSNWAEAGHESTARGGAGYAENSSGQWAEGAHSNVTNSSVARTSSGDVYAGHDGNVYRNTGSGWQTYDNGSWNNVTKPSSTQAVQGQSAAASAQSQWKNNWSSGSNWQSSWENRSSSSAAGQNSWSSHDTQQSLNSDSWARNQGNANSWSHSGGGWGGSHDWNGGGGGGGWGGHGGWSGGGGFRGRR